MINSLVPAHCTTPVLWSATASQGQSWREIGSYRIRDNQYNWVRYPTMWDDGIHH